MWAELQETSQPRAQNWREPAVTAVPVRKKPSWFYPAESTSIQFSPKFLPKETAITAIIFIWLCWNSLHFYLVLYNIWVQPLHTAAQGNSKAIGDFGLLSYNRKRHPTLRGMRSCLKKLSVWDEKPNTFRGLPHLKYIRVALATFHELLGIWRKFPRGFIFLIAAFGGKDKIYSIKMQISETHEKSLAPR